MTALSFFFYSHTVACHEPINRVVLHKKACNSRIIDVSNLKSTLNFRCAKVFTSPKINFETVDLVTIFFSTFRFQFYFYFPRCHLSCCLLQHISLLCQPVSTLILSLLSFLFSPPFSALFFPLSFARLFTRPLTHIYIYIHTYISFFLLFAFSHSPSSPPFSLSFLSLSFSLFLTIYARARARIPHTLHAYTHTGIPTTHPFHLCDVQLSVAVQRTWDNFFGHVKFLKDGKERQRESRG